MLISLKNQFQIRLLDNSNKEKQYIMKNSLANLESKDYPMLGRLQRATEYVALVEHLDLRDARKDQGIQFRKDSIFYKKSNIVSAKLTTSKGLGSERSL